MTAHHVYVCRQEDGRALYVGCSRVLFDRLDGHGRSSFWAPLVASVAAKVYPSKETGLAAERLAIKTEQPRFNVIGRWQHRATWAIADYDDYLMAALSRPNTSWKQQHIAQVRQCRDLLVRLGDDERIAS